MRISRCLGAVGIAILEMYLCCLDAGVVYAAADSRPNILVIVVDDMGYSDPGCYGGEIETPSIDNLASKGIRFTQFYNCSRCTSTRASLLTGAYPHRVGMREFGLTMDKNVPTLAENLRDSGYATAMVGKWHLSELPTTRSEAERILWINHELDLDRPFAEKDSYPLQRGFEKFYGVIWGVVNHFDPFSLMDEDKPVKEVPDDFYMTDAVSDRSIDYLRELSQQDKPFFLYVAYTAPHWPIQARPEEIAKYKERYTSGWNELRRERFARQQELGLFASENPLGELSGDGRIWESLLSPGASLPGKQNGRARGYGRSRRPGHRQDRQGTRRVGPTGEHGHHVLLGQRRVTRDSRPARLRSV